MKMENSRRKFIKRTSQFTLATGLSMWTMSCDFSPSEKINSEDSFLEIARVFSDNMILQRAEPILVWGWTNPSATVELFFDGKKYKTVATNDEGKWIFNLSKKPKGEQHELMVKQGLHEIKIKNILMGDVYLCSGQSNMEWPMDRVDNATFEIENAIDKKIRHFKIPPVLRFESERNLSGGEWQICSPKTVKNFSAAAYFFAKNMKQKYDVPIGLVNATRGSSTIKMWMSSDALGIKNKEELLKVAIEKRLARLSEKYNFSPKEKSNSIKETAKVDLISDCKSIDYNDFNWVSILLPMQWGNPDFMEMLGKIWYRKVFYLKNKPAKTAEIKINIAQIDDADFTFLNGEKIGNGNNDYDQVRTYQVAPSILKKGKNVLAICIENYQAFGGVFGKSEDLFLEIEYQKISLAGDWKMKIEKLQYNQDWLFGEGEIPSVLYHSMIFPLKNFSFRAILWYQGESDARRSAQEVFDYRFHFQQLIISWRKLFGKEKLPFIFAQISNAYAGCHEPSDSSSARLRESQEQALQLENTFQVINIDSGKHENTLHPQNKPELGKRFSLAVRKLVFKEEIIANGPIYKEMKIEGKYIHIFFLENVKVLLLNNEDKVKELAIAGKDQEFLWAKSRVEENHLVVWHDEVEEPVAVRYAWCDNPLEVNLYNSEGLPAGPFRTDDW